MATQIARHWRMKAQRYQLAGHSCSQCNTPMLQARVVCPVCANAATQPVASTTSVNESPLLIQVPHPDSLVIYHRKFNPASVEPVVVKRPPTQDTI